jgi:hypothetical protein
MKRWMRRGATGAAAVVASVSTALAADVKPVGAFQFPLSGLSVDVGQKPHVVLWCQGLALLGVVVPDDGKADCSTPTQKRVLPRAFLLRDGRCEADGSSISFGFLVPRKAWLFESGGRIPEERVALLLHRFEGSVRESQLTGSLVQVDVSHPGYAFQKRTVEAGLLPSEQPSYADEGAWRTGVTQSYCVAAAEHWPSVDRPPGR